jgi:hypothetical protein
MSMPYIIVYSRAMPYGLIQIENNEGGGTEIPKAKIPVLGYLDPRSLTVPMFRNTDFGLQGSCNLQVSENLNGIIFFFIDSPAAVTYQTFRRSMQNFLPLKTMKAQDLKHVWVGEAKGCILM